MKDLEKTIEKDDAIEALIKRAFEEDVRSGDITTNSVVDEDYKAEAIWVAKEEGIIAGVDIARRVFEKLDSDILWSPHVSDGENVSEKTKLVTIKGNARAMLTAERIALNIAQRMSGIATTTRRYIEEIGVLNTKILDTRKTVPGLRLLDKQAVAAGGGTNHRMGLFDLAMIKDNHIVAAGSIEAAMQRVRKNAPAVRIEVETSCLDEVKKALAAGADIIMLDNMSAAKMKEAVKLINGQAETEASGNITLDRVAEVASTGVDFISVGALTHSVTAFDISQQLQEIYK
ncbi:carboxylating nicotinate-nucleotide diphosphorylase [Fodinibius halophilus]|uniref:Probable nicotinate-nucleotide pyrophosphorylase [carboxylating] n=1 Tax=Fodinibius halophilus TaxID=1736908 RepID=A0A6M1TC91_9BACT|nr:carboxylating nicotinate-nucleotide diphosphorylase [Fodinibius halophilus]NGP89611.1 carboxylating nicotinate-nucleotide diphosphorylase [Fodinibius halophilus]